MTNESMKSECSRKSANPRASVEIHPVRRGEERRGFLRLPWSLYRDDSAWVPPLLYDRGHQLSESNPYFRHAAFQAWIARRGGETVGRISAQVDQLHQERYGDRTGFFGLIEAVDDPDVFQALFTTAENWLRGKGMRRVRGPFNLSINEECGLLVEGFDTPPMIMMGHTRPYYGGRIEECGYAGGQDLLAYWIGMDFPLPRHLEALIARAGKGVTLRPLRRKHFAEDLAIIKDIYEDAWLNNWGFLPFTAEELEELGRNLKLLVPLDHVRIAELDGEPVAMMVAFPNINEAIRDLNGRLLPLGWLKLLWRLKVRGLKTARIPLMGVRGRFQASRLGATLALMMITSLRSRGLELGVEKVELSWILESNQGMRSIIESLGGKAYKRYRIYEKDLV